jgi:hypothetical protein
LTAALQITGQPSVLYYAVTIFRSANFGKSSAAFASLGVAFVKLVTTLYVGVKVRVLVQYKKNVPLGQRS